MMKVGVALGFKGAILYIKKHLPCSPKLVFMLNVDNLVNSKDYALQDIKDPFPY